MKIALAADISFSRFTEFPGKEAALAAMAQPARLFAAADFSVINLETVFGKKDDHIPLLKSGPNLIALEEFIEYVDALAPSAVGLANNHTFDFGKSALDNTRRLLDERGYPYCGAGDNIAEAYRPVVFEKDGQRVAVIAVCENEFGTAGEDTAGSAGYDLTRVTAAIREVRADGCLPIVFFHGGNEWYAVPSPGKVALYRHFIDIGAAAVIAMHTHCPQGYEMYNGSPIVYSMGNFFFPRKDAAPAASWYYGYITLLDIGADGIGLEIVPYTFDFDAVRLLDGEEKAQFMRYLEHISGIIADPVLLREFFDSWCIQSYVAPLIYGLESPQDADEPIPTRLVQIKNVFSCEAHNELVTNTFKMMYEGRMKTAGKHLEHIKALQNMRIPE